MHDRIRSIEICLRELRGEKSIVGWIEGPWRSRLNCAA